MAVLSRTMFVWGILMAIFMGSTLQGCGGDEEGDDSTTAACTATKLDVCVTGLNSTLAMTDCDQVQTFLTCVTGCCSYSWLDNPTTATTMDGQAAQGTVETASTYWFGKSELQNCSLTNPCA
eukprot:Skav207890  [mRNA]  locus=scaffold664:736083:736448:- [translate_table: standard]